MVQNCRVTAPVTATQNACGQAAPPRLPSVGGIGKVVVDQVIRCDHQPEPDGHQHVTRLLTAGGGAANVAGNVAAHGFPAVVAGWAGADDGSAQALGQLAGLGVELRVVRRGRAPFATVLAWAGDRSFLVDQGDLRGEAADVRAAWFEGLDVVHINGFDLLDYSWPTVIFDVVDMARRLGVAVSVDTPTTARIHAQGASSFRDSLARVAPDVLFANASEAEALGLDRWPGWAGLLVVHAGLEPSVVHRRQGSEAYPVDLVVPNPETTGCGDAFAAGFLTAWAQDLSVAGAVDRAHAWAAEIADVVGAQPGGPPVSPCDPLRRPGY
ncbi:MAG: hypothetical protein RLZ55_1523 [Actinomycetota bacterium]